MEEQENTKKKRGCPPYQPTEESRRQVSEMVAFGTPHEQIAIVININAKTLRKHYKEEIRRSAIVANHKVAQTLFKMATSGKDVAATIFWAKTRNHFRVPPPEPNPQQQQLQQPQQRPTILVVNNDGGPIL